MKSEWSRVMKATLPALEKAMVNSIIREHEWWKKREKMTREEAIEEYNRASRMLAVTDD